MVRRRWWIPDGARWWWWWTALTGLVVLSASSWLAAPVNHSIDAPPASTLFGADPARRARIERLLAGAADDGVWIDDVVRTHLTPAVDDVDRRRPVVSLQLYGRGSEDARAAFDRYVALCRSRPEVCSERLVRTSRELGVAPTALLLEFPGDAEQGRIYLGTDGRPRFERHRLTAQRAQVREIRGGEFDAFTRRQLVLADDAAVGAAEDAEAVSRWVVGWYRARAPRTSAGPTDASGGRVEVRDLRGLVTQDDMVWEQLTVDLAPGRDARRDLAWVTLVTDGKCCRADRDTPPDDAAFSDMETQYLAGLQRHTEAVAGELYRAIRAAATADGR